MNKERLNNYLRERELARKEQEKAMVLAGTEVFKNNVKFIYRRNLIGTISRIDVLYKFDNVYKVADSYKTPLFLDKKELENFVDGLYNTLIKN